MKHLKTYKLFESKFLNPIEKYLYPLMDLGFEITKNDNNQVNSPGDLTLFMKIDNPDDNFLKEVLDEYLTLIDRLKDEFTIKGNRISIGSGSSPSTGINIEIFREVEDINQEIEMDEDQRIAYDAISKCLKEDEKLKVESYSTNFISFSKYRNNAGDYKWVTIYSNGKIKLPILRGYKSQNITELPFTDDDIKWFKRIIWSDDAYNKLHKVSDFGNEFDQLHEKTQQELREIYK